MRMNSTSSFEGLKHQSCVNFLAGDESIKIVPMFTHDKSIELLSVPKLGPFTALTPISVPLWLAIQLKQKSLCRIPTPHWMEVESLQRILLYEKSQDRFSRELPFRYMEISRSLLSSSAAGGGELEEEDSIRILLQDISSIRMDKIRRNLHTLSVESLGTTDILPVIDVTGIGSLELATIAPFCTTAFDHHLMLSRKDDVKNNIKDTSGKEDGENGNNENNLFRRRRAASRLRKFR
mmetsp:Transcript_4523/g.5233  ORF Transcript_4523/g.5233 Transcript_4523/m.5233 type:complete len:236 (+) Transcript_4523:62-769(+)